MIEEYRNLIDGKMIATDQWMDVVNPANEEIIGKVPSCGEDQLNKAVVAARQAFKSWSKSSLEERRGVLHAIADAIEANHDDLFRLLTRSKESPTHKQRWRSEERLQIFVHKRRWNFKMLLTRIRKIDCLELAEYLWALSVVSFPGTSRY